MRLLRLAGVVALALALVAASCGPQPRDDEETKDGAEEVYIFPDGFGVRGEAAAWVQEVKQEFKLGQVDVKTITPEMITNVFGDTFFTPKVPERFHLLAYGLTHNEEADFRMANAAWVNPGQREVIRVTASNTPGGSSVTGVWTYGPECYEPKDQVITDAEGNVVAVEPKIPWSSLECYAGLTVQGVTIDVRTINMPHNEALAMLRDFLTAHTR